MDIKEFRQPELISSILSDIRKLASTKSNEEFKFMEVCGTHTMTIGQWGIRRLLPDNIKLVSGPGCPVCVTPSSVIDELIKMQDVTIVTFGDLIRIPGSNATLEQARAAGLKVKTVYSPLEALKMAQKEDIIFIGIGFETTAPGIAYSLMEAKSHNLLNFSLLSLCKLVPPAISALLSDDDVRIDGFILPGHVSVVIGARSYSFIPEKFGISGVVTGFEPLDIVLAIKRLLELSEPKIINEYSRAVTEAGNKRAQEMISSVFEVKDINWRGLGIIPRSGLMIREEFAQFDAEKRYNLEIVEEDIDVACQCGDVLKGIKIPPECPLFKHRCNPGNPVGPCMVSSEGSCAAYYRYET